MNGGGPGTLAEALFAVADGDGGQLVFHLEDRVVRLPYDELAERARRGAASLQRLGLALGEPLGRLLGYEPIYAPAGTPATATA